MSIIILEVAMWGFWGWGSAFCDFCSLKSYVPGNRIKAFEVDVYRPYGGKESVRIQACGILNVYFGKWFTRILFELFMVT